VSTRVVDALPPSMAVWVRWAWTVLFVERQEAQLEGLLQGRAADVWAVEGQSDRLCPTYHASDKTL
jgi:hypothetical protein